MSKTYGCDLMEQEQKFKEDKIEVVSLEELASIRKDINEYKEAMQKAENEFNESTKKQRKKLDDFYDSIREPMEQAEKIYDELFKKACENATFSEDRFLKAVKVKGDSYKEGRYRIIRHSKDIRKLNQEAFKQKYPKEFNSNAKIGLTDADNAVGKNRVTALCQVNTEYKYELYIPELIKEE